MTNRRKLIRVLQKLMWPCTLAGVGQGAVCTEFSELYNLADPVFEICETVNSARSPVFTSYLEIGQEGLLC